jgi:1-acyl-sn-glycerol-3-phosphate acyltransferase
MMLVKNENFVSIVIMFEEKFNNLKLYLENRYKNSPDPWGLLPEKVINDLRLLWPLYHYYFDVKLHHQEMVEDRPYMVISNHTGQVPIDALLICTAFATELSHPRILRPLVERFLTSLPFLGRWSSEAGAVLGDRHNCLNLLKRNESVLIFPEGVKGIAKEASAFYHLQPFTKGFLRMAIAAKVEILPIAVVGAEEFFPFVFHLKKIAKFLKIPALPLSPNLFPLPSPVDIYIGKPYLLPNELSPDAMDDELEPHLLFIENEIERLTQEGLENRRTILNRIKK